MDTSSATTEAPRRDPDRGRVAVPEIIELLELRRRPAAAGAGVTVLLGLLLTLVAPGLLPANAFTGAVVGLFAVLAGVVLAVLVDGRDPVLRGPRHVRRDGHAVLGRMAGADASLHGGEVLAALERRIEASERLRVVLTGTGADPSELAVALGRGAADHGHTSLVVDLRSTASPGVADVGRGEVRLGEAARLADDRPYAWIGAGIDGGVAVEATVGVAERPPRDLDLLLVVAPDVATQVPSLLEVCDRTVVLVAADTEPRAMVGARLDALRRAGAVPEVVVVGGAAVATPVTTDAADTPATTDTRDTTDTTDAADEPVDATAQRSHEERPGRTHEPSADTGSSSGSSSVTVIPPTPPGAASPPSREHAVPSDGRPSGSEGDPGEDGPAPEPEASPTELDDAAVPPDSPSDPRADAAAAMAVPGGARDDRWELRSRTSRTSSTTVGAVDVDGMAVPDALTTAAALDRLDARRDPRAGD